MRLQQSAHMHMAASRSSLYFSTSSLFVVGSASAASASFVKPANVLMARSICAVPVFSRASNSSGEAFVDATWSRIESPSFLYIWAIWNCACRRRILTVSIGRYLFMYSISSFLSPSLPWQYESCASADA